MAKKVLGDYESHVAKFWQVIPPAEDNTSLTHADIEREVVAAAETTTASSVSSRSGAPAVAMTAT